MRNVVSVYVHVCACTTHAQREHVIRQKILCISGYDAKETIQVLWHMYRAPSHTGRTNISRAERGGGWAETNRKQAFFIQPSILNACLTYEAWFGDYPYSNAPRFLFSRALHFASHRRTTPILMPRIRTPRFMLSGDGARTEWYLRNEDEILVSLFCTL